MAHPIDPQRQRVGSVLVLLQFSLLALLAVLALPVILQRGVPLAAWLIGLGAVTLGGWTLLHNRLGNFNIHPEPKAEGVLVTSGPYRLMRHPMYSTVLLGAAALASVPHHGLAWLLWLALLATLLAKSMLEEHWLREHHPQYAGYCARCKRFVPWIF